MPLVRCTCNCDVPVIAMTMGNYTAWLCDGDDVGDGACTGSDYYYNDADYVRWRRLARYDDTMTIDNQTMSTVLMTCV